MAAGAPVSRCRLWAFAVVALLLLGAGWLTGDRPPAWAPPCPFHFVTGLHCPGCGSTRAVLALLHGEWVRALQLNALLVLTLPALAWWTVWSFWRGVRHGLPPVDTPRPAATIVLAVVLLFFVLRNLPWWPFCLLAPHG